MLSTTPINHNYQSIWERDMLDLLIKNGKVVDGSGLPAFTADVGIRDGVIVKIGRVQ